MKAAVCSAHGAPDVVRVADLIDPHPGPGQVRVRVEAAAVNFPDLLMIADAYQISVPPPFIPGSEFAGFVDEIGSSTTGIAPGDRVSGVGLFGAFAQQVVVDADTLTPIPEGIDAHTAAAFGVAHRTSYHALRSSARLAPGDDLVVLGAGGGVGLAAVQLGVTIGAHVTAVASSAEKLSVAQAYGATRLIDHTAVDLRATLRTALPDGADVVLDPVGGRLSEPALRSLRRGGRFLTIGFASGTIPQIPLNLVLVKGVLLRGFTFQDVPSDEFDRNEAELRALFAEGRAVPHIGAIYALDHVVEALQHVADGRAIGKIVIDMR